MWGMVCTDVVLKIDIYTKALTIRQWSNYKHVFECVPMAVFLFLKIQS